MTGSCGQDCALYPFFPVRKTSGNRKCHRILNFCYFMPSNLGCYKREEITIFLNYGGKNEGGDVYIRSCV